MCVRRQATSWVAMAGPVAGDSCDTGSRGLRLDQLPPPPLSCLCHPPAQVKSGGVMGVGKVNSSSVGMIVLPSAAPFTPPFVIRGRRPQPWAPRRDAARAVVIALAIMVGVFSITLLSCLGFLVYRLVKAGRQKRSSHIITTTFEDGVGRYDVGLGPAPQQEIGQGAVSLEHQARRHGSTGGL